VCDVLRKAQAVNQRKWEQMSRQGWQYVETQLNPVTLGERIWQVLTQTVAVNRPQSAMETTHD
jgi:hypothetical protein